jgi:hypothetical protein
MSAFQELNTDANIITEQTMEESGDVSIDNVELSSTGSVSQGSVLNATNQIQTETTQNEPSEVSNEIARRRNLMMNNSRRSNMPPPTIVIQKSSPMSPMYFIFHIIISFFAIYLSFKCNKGFDFGGLLMALFFPHIYIIYKYATSDDFCGLRK